jgi:hypothetical protein
MTFECLIAPTIQTARAGRSDGPFRLSCIAGIDMSQVTYGLGGWRELCYNSLHGQGSANESYLSRKIRLVNLERPTRPVI